MQGPSFQRKKAISLLGVVLLILMACLLISSMYEGFFLVFYGKRHVQFTLPTGIVLLLSLMLLTYSSLLYLECRRPSFLILGTSIGVLILLHEYTVPSLPPLAGLLYVAATVYYHGDRRITVSCSVLLLSVYTFMAFLSVIHYVSALTFKARILSDLAQIEAMIFYAPGYNVSSLLALIILYSWPLSLLTRLLPKFSDRWSRTPSMGMPHERYPYYIIPLTISPVLVIALAYLRQANKGIGVDYSYYVMALEDVSGVNFPYLLSRQRSLYLTLSYMLYSLTGDTHCSVRLLTFVIAVLLAVVVFLSAKRLYGPYEGIWSMFSATFSPIFAASMFAAIFSNWLALIPLYGFIACLPDLVQLRKGHLLLGIILSILVLLAHPWTWNILMASLLLLAISLYLRRRDLQKIYPLLIIVLINVAFDRLRLLAFGAGGLEVGEVTSRSTLSLNNLYKFPLYIYLTFRYYLAGSFTDIPFLLMAFIGLIVIYRRGDIEGAFIRSWLLISSLMFPFLSRGIHWRILYDIPFLLLAGVGLAYVTRSIQDTRLRHVIILSYVLSQVSYDLRVMSILPSQLS